MNYYILKRLREQEQRGNIEMPIQPMTKLVNTEFQDNHGVVISGGRNQVTIIMKDGEIESVTEQSETPKQEPQPAAQPQPTTQPQQPTYPKPNKYTEVVEWLNEELKKGIDHYKNADFNRAKMCRNLSDIFGWVVDRNALGKSQQLYNNSH